VWQFDRQNKWKNID